MTAAQETNIAALAMVIQASLAEMRECAQDMVRNAKAALPRLIEEASVLSGALQRLDKALDEAPASAGMVSRHGRTDTGLKSAQEITSDPEAAAKWLLALDRAHRLGRGHRCRRCGGVL